MITAKEEITFYGEEVTEQQFYESVKRAGNAYDADDLQTAAYELAKPILAAIVENDFAQIGYLLSEAKKATCLRRAEFECYGYIKTPEFTA